MLGGGVGTACTVAWLASAPSAASSAVTTAAWPPWAAAALSGVHLPLVEPCGLVDAGALRREQPGGHCRVALWGGGEERRAPALGVCGLVDAGALRREQLLNYARAIGGGAAERRLPLTSFLRWHRPCRPQLQQRLGGARVACGRRQWSWRAGCPARRRWRWRWRPAGSLARRPTVPTAPATRRARRARLLAQQAPCSVVACPLSRRCARPCTRPDRRASAPTAAANAVRGRSIFAGPQAEAGCRPCPLQPPAVG